ncbi:hypothetical protein H2198_009479 [Neophaeococcomyces mojaviensis]|uniref:Uncharacterized protein n=1 Tax=Neophaeococcomyces mojaviensis TaxID=3383035 RepID=A0ACC2ZU77_9EURO|nr:hypothetical protein H2198_009479 [Knufia sp. JES_112]
MNVVDIRPERRQDSLVEEVKDGLHADPPQFSSMLLWNEPGLKYFEALTKTPEYYLTRAEMELFRKYGEDIARNIPSNAILVDLGSGSLQKVKILLDAFDRIGSAIDYYALDVDRKELDRTLDLVKPGTFEHVRCHGLCGTYDDFVDWVRNSQGSRPLCLLSLGSTIGSFSGAEAADFLRDFAEALEARDARNECSGQSLMLIGIDGCKDGSMVWHAYNDGDAANDRFIRNCLDHANTVLGSNVFEYSDWDRIGNWNAELGRHEQFLIPKRDVRVDGVSLKAGKKILVVCSHKFDADDRDILWREAGLKPVKSWTSTQTDYGLHLVSPRS